MLQLTARTSPWARALLQDSQIPQASSTPSRSTSTPSTERWRHPEGPSGCMSGATRRAPHPRGAGAAPPILYRAESAFLDAAGARGTSTKLKTFPPSAADAMLFLPGVIDSTTNAWSIPRERRRPDRRGRGAVGDGRASSPAWTAASGLLPAPSSSRKAWCGQVENPPRARTRHEAADAPHRGLPPGYDSVGITRPVDEPTMGGHPRGVRGASARLRGQGLDDDAQIAFSGASAPGVTPA